MTSNDVDTWHTFREAAAEVVGEDAARECDTVMTGEDFSFLAKAAFRITRWALITLRSARRTRCTVPLRHGRAFAVGARIHVAAAKRALRLAAEAEEEEEAAAAGKKKATRGAGEGGGRHARRRVVKGPRLRERRTEGRLRVCIRRDGRGACVASLNLGAEVPC